MNRKKLFLFIAVCGLAAGWIRMPAAEEPPKRVIGQTARVAIQEVSLEFLARVDTGAASSSMHAESVRIQGEMVDFIAVNQDGARVPMRMPVARTATVRNSGGGKERIFVEMTLNHEGRSKQVCVNLNDRSGLNYPMLLGRNWLADEYIVDVSHQPEDPGDKRELAAREW
jgi:hypothetical protein